MKALLIAKKSINDTITKGREYAAVYDFEARLWLITNDKGILHALHVPTSEHVSTVNELSWVRENFDIIPI